MARRGRSHDVSLPGRRFLAATGGDNLDAECGINR